jgi:hypothetical protein
MLWIGTGALFLEGSGLLDMNNCLSCGCQHVDDYGLLINADLIELIHYNTFSQLLFGLV